MIRIGTPTLKEQNDKVIMTCKITINKKEEELFYEIDKKYKEYICIERADAFVIAAFYYAMKHHHDIESKLPMTSELYHNLTTYIIPTLAKHSNNLSNIKINVPLTNEPLETKGEVGTGMSCGIDSFHTIKNYVDPKSSEMKLTCLCLNNVGSFKAYDEKYRGSGSDKVRNDLIKRAEKVANILNLPLMVTNSNVFKIFNDTYFRVHTFANMFSVFMMQKYFSKYYYASSGYDLAHYNVIDSYKLDSAEYDILTFYALETNTLKIYPEGNEKTRLEKTIDLADYEPAKKHLHVCIKNSENCGKCIKCRRTLLALEAIGKLDNFSEVFDIEYYKENKEEYYKWLEKEEEEGHEMNVLTAKLLRQKNGETIYKDIEEFNKNNIVLKETYLNSLSISTNGKNILNKNSNDKYKNDLCYKLNICLELSKEKNKELKIPKYMLDNVKVYMKNQKTLKKKLKYIKRIITKKKTKINLHDLIYFLLYKPSTSKNIIKFLKKEGYLKNIKKEATTTEELMKLYKKIDQNKELRNKLQISEIKIKDKVLKNNNPITKNKDTYYDNNQYQETFVTKDKENYYFLGKSNEYYVAIISKNRAEKNALNEDIEEAYSFIKQLNK